MPEENFEQPIEPISLGSPAAEPDDSGAARTINRPAKGARIVSPDDVLAGHFAASESAGDFLGLDTELTGASAPHDLELARAPGSVSVDQETLEESDARAPGALLSTPDSSSSDDVAEEDEDFFDEADPGDFSGEYDEEYDEDYEEEYDYAEQQSSSTLKIVGAFAAGLVVVLGVTMGPGLLSSSDAPTEIATAPISNPTQPVASGQPVDSGQPEDSGQALEPAGVLGSDPKLGTLSLAGELPILDAATGRSPDIKVPSSGMEGMELASESTGTSTSEPLAAEFRGDAAPFVEGAESLQPEVFGFGADPLSELSNDNKGATTAALGAGFPDFGKGFEWATPAELDMIWRGENIPMEAIQAPARTMMPYVGMVRATLANGDSLNGKLHAMGEGSVWLRDMSNGGLLGLDGRLIASIERLATEAGAPLSQNNPINTASSRRVRVKLAGGTISGTLLSRDGEWVTIRTASGGSVRLLSPEMEVITQERVILLRD